MSRFLAPLSLSIATVLLASAPSAQAVDVLRNDVQHTAALCRASSSEQMARLRWRPLSVTNISDQNVFLTCALQGDDAQFSTRGSVYVGLQASNEEGTVAHALDCTLVNGQVSGGVAYANYATKSVTIQPGGGSVIEWQPSEVPNSGTTIKLPALSCLLRPGMAINHLGRRYNENVGA